MLSRKWFLFPALFLFLFLAGCASAQASTPSSNAGAQAVATIVAATLHPSATLAASVATPYESGLKQSSTANTPVIPPTITSTPTVTVTPGPSPTATQDARPDPASWEGWAPVPTVSARAREIYQAGLKLGNNPQAFSTIGDCQSEPEVFLGVYERGGYALGDYKYLQKTIDYFKGSFNRKSAAVKDGMSVASVLNPMWNDPAQCRADEKPIDCELRVHKPALMFVNLGTNWKNGGPTAYEKYLREIVQELVDRGVVPVLTTKADNIEGDNSLNLATARVAHDFDVPLMNWWATAGTLPDHGLDPSRDNVYLTVQGWNLRNFTALLTLDAVRVGLTSSPTTTVP